MPKKTDETIAVIPSQEDDIILLKKALYALAEHTGGLHILEQFFPKPE